MKTKYLFLLLLLSGSVTSLAQSDVLKDSIRIEEIYLTFDEFRSNSPSLPGRVLVLEKDIKLYDSAACSNNRVYVYIKRPDKSVSPVVCLLESIDRYCFFSASLETGLANTLTPIPVNSTIPDFDGIRGDSDPNAIYKNADFVVNINNGITYEVSHKLMKIILKRDPELLAVYEKDKERRQNYKKYILEYNAKHQDEIKPLSH